MASDLAGFASALVSDFVSPLESPPLASALDSVFSALPSPESELPFFSELSLIAVVLLRLSVEYQPLPLKTTVGAVSTRLAVPPRHSWQRWRSGAEKLSRNS